MSEGPLTQLRLEFDKIHQEGAQRACASSFVLNATFKVNGFHAQQSIVAAISSMGGEHAPLVRCQLMLADILRESKPDFIEAYVSSYNKTNKIPGFGSGFVKGEPDPIHKEIDHLIAKIDPKKHYYMVELHHAVQDQIDRNLFPNTALYSAMTSIILNWSPYVLPGFAIQARMPVWNHILSKTLLSVRDEQRAKEQARKTKP